MPPVIVTRSPVTPARRHRALRTSRAYPLVRDTNATTVPVRWGLASEQRAASRLLPARRTRRRRPPRAARQATTPPDHARRPGAGQHEGCSTRLSATDTAPGSRRSGSPSCSRPAPSFPPSTARMPCPAGQCTAVQCSRLHPRPAHPHRRIRAAQRLRIHWPGPVAGRRPDRRRVDSRHRRHRMSCLL